MINKVNKINKIFVLIIIGPIDIILFFYPNHTYNTLPQPKPKFVSYSNFFFSLLFYLFHPFLPPFLSLFLVFLSLCCPRVLFGGSSFSHFFRQVKKKVDTSWSLLHSFSLSLSPSLLLRFTGIIVKPVLVAFACYLLLGGATGIAYHQLHN